MYGMYENGESPKVEAMRAEVRARRMGRTSRDLIGGLETPGEKLAGRIWLAVAILALLVLLGMGLAVS